MAHHDEIDDVQRRLLIKMLTAAAMAASGITKTALAEGLLGTVPEKLPPGQSVYSLVGSVEVNGKQATQATQIGPSDTVKTGSGSNAIFVVGGHAMLLRSNSHLIMEAEQQNPVIGLLRLITGKILCVSRDSSYKIRTPTATIGIRGTGTYTEADAEQTYFCTCYGITDVNANNDPASKESVESKHHDKPLYILGNEAAGRNIRSAPFINHTDQELMLVEALLGRTPPFVFPDDKYTAPRRRY